MANSRNSPCYSLMTTRRDKQPLPHFPRWIWHVVPTKEFMRYAELGVVDHRLNSFSGAEGSERFYEVFYDWWVRNVEPKVYI